MRGIFNIINCGVGGQGVVLMANIVGKGCTIKGINVVSGELHGLSQRSGSVVAHQRIGEGAVSPLVPCGEGDVILALEPMEALRYLYFAKPGGTVISSSRIIHPPIETEWLATGKIDGYVRYEDVKRRIADNGYRYVEIDSLGLASRAGNPQTQNVVMVGALSASPGFPVNRDIMKEAVRMTVPKRAVDINLKAFDLGYAAAEE
ncbi:MAG: indolepyruvate oxidoreductase subunit beta [Thermoplasmatota archaeon]